MSGHCSELTELEAVPTINDIFRRFGPAYLNKYASSMPRSQIKATLAIMRCRTAQAGSVVYRCTQCDRKHEVYRSCGNRNCPSCQGNKAHAWLDKQLSMLLPCTYFMVTFTVPTAMRDVMRSHHKECYRAFFRAAYATMSKLARDPKYLGSDRLGMTGVLHTWGRDVGYHPHLHFIVPGGALSSDGLRWLASRSEFFIPVLAASPIFRAKYQAEMKRAGLFDQIPSKAWQVNWNIHSKAVGDGRASLKYLAPYVFRLAIGNHRIIRVSDGPDGLGQVTFGVRPSKSNRYRSMTVSAEEFLSRYLQHVLPSGFQKVRHFGFMHPKSKTQWDWLSMLVTVTLNMVYVLTVMAKPETKRNMLLCSECGGELACMGFLPPITHIIELDTS